MRLSSLVLLTVALACGRSAEPPDNGGGPADGAGATVDSASGTQVVVLRAGPLHVEPDEDSPGITDVPAGMLLRAVDEHAPQGWVRVATWDDRRGWIPESRLIPRELWAHYGRALGGISPVLLRPAYPVEGGRWVVEAPMGSPGFTPASSAWLLGDPAEIRVVAIDSIENACGGERYRAGVLDEVFLTTTPFVIDESAHAGVLKIFDFEAEGATLIAEGRTAADESWLFRRWRFNER